VLSNSKSKITIFLIWFLGGSKCGKMGDILRELNITHIAGLPYAGSGAMWVMVTTGSTKAIHIQPLSGLANRNAPSLDS
jgi:hypothetical protein